MGQASDARIMALERASYCWWVRLSVGLLASAVFPRMSVAMRQYIDLSGEGWTLWLDKEASWEEDELHLPPVDVANLPSRPPTGGWQGVDDGCAVSVPGTVEEYLWDDEVGIYVVGTNGAYSDCSDDPANYFQDWERPINIEYYDPEGNLGFNQIAGTRIYGACSRKAERKSLAIFARGKYGDKDFDYKLFKDKDIDEFKSFIIRNSGNDNRETLLRDGMMQTLVKDRLDVDYQEYQPCIHYLNGEYWGILNIREKLNEDYLEANHGVDPDNVDILSGGYYFGVIEGTDTHYIQMLQFISSNDMTDPDNYDYVATQMDVDEFINYLITEIYVKNTDWPLSNIKFWRPQTTDGKWRWLLYDLDFGFDCRPYDGDMVEKVTTDPEVDLIMDLLTNDEFMHKFVQRFCSHINTTFQPERVIGIIDSLAANIEAEIPFQVDKFYFPASEPEIFPAGI